jgi:hypothetical protein
MYKILYIVETPANAGRGKKPRSEPGERDLYSLVSENRFTIGLKSAGLMEKSWRKRT